MERFAQMHGHARVREVPTLRLDLVRPHWHTRSKLLRGCLKFWRGPQFVTPPPQPVFEAKKAEKLVQKIKNKTTFFEFLVGVTFPSA